MSKQNIIEISIAKNFSIYPGARYRTDGENSGQEFYEEKLRPILTKIWEINNTHIILDFDGTFGYASSFISEVFISVVRDFKDKKKIKKILKFKSNDDPLLVDAILNIIEKAENQ